MPNTFTVTLTPSPDPGAMEVSWTPPSGQTQLYRYGIDSQITKLSGVYSFTISASYIGTGRGTWYAKGMDPVSFTKHYGPPDPIAPLVPGGPPIPPYHPPGPPHPTPGTGVQVSGISLQLNGSPFLPLGWNSVAGIWNPTFFTGNKTSTYTAAKEQFAQTLVNLATWSPSINCIRFQVVQNAINDPANSAAYLTYIQSLVTATEGASMVPILCMQDNLPAPMRDSQFEKISDGNGNPGFTKQAWQRLAPVFAADQTVMYEILNEPVWDGWTNKNDPAPIAAWALWTSTNQTIINTIRTAGAPNTIVAGGQDGNVTFNGMPALLQGDNICYAIHGYYGWNESPAKYDLRFGDLAAQAPVIFTEWYNTSYGNDSDGTVSRFLHYLQAHNVGLLGWVFDHKGNTNEMDRITGVDNSNPPSSYASGWTHTPNSWPHVTAVSIQTDTSKFTAATPGTLQVDDTTGFPSSGRIEVRCTNGIDSIINYGAKTGTTFNKCVTNKHPGIASIGNYVVAPGGSGTRVQSWFNSL